MKITRVNTVLLSGPSSGGDPFMLSFRKLRSAAFVEIQTDEGVTGVGETTLGYHMPEIIPEIVRFYEPILVGLSDEQINPRVLWQRMNRCMLFWSHGGVLPGVLAAIEGALWDLKGKMLGIPVHQLLGGCMHERLLCYATGCESPHPNSELLRKVDLYRSAGFRAAKFAAGWYDHKTRDSFASDNVSAWVEMESQKLETLRKHVGKDFAICLDGHMGNVDEGKKPWDVAIASAVLKAIEPYDPFFYEEPLDYRDLDGYRELSRQTSIPIAGGEVLSTREEFYRWAEARALDIAQPDASIGGIGAFVDVARMFAAVGKRVAPHCWASGPGTMQNIHAAFASPNVAIVEVPPLPGGLHTEIYAEGYRFQDGYLLPPQAPGLGVRLTDKIKQKFAFIPGSGEWNAVPGKTEYL